MKEQPELWRAGRVAALAAESGTYPSMQTACEVIPHLGMAQEAADQVHDWIYHGGLNPLTPDRLKVIVAEFIAACVGQDVDPFQVIPHMHASTHRVIDRWRDIHRQTWNTAEPTTPVGSRRAS